MGTSPADKDDILAGNLRVVASNKCALVSAGLGFGFNVESILEAMYSYEQGADACILGLNRELSYR